MISSDSAAKSQKHCKKQLAPLLSQDSSLSSNSSSNNNLVTSVTAYNVSKPTNSTHPSEKSTTRLPHISKHIRQKLHAAKKPSYSVALPNTSKSLPVQTKLGHYFKSIATMTTKQNPSLKPMRYKKSQAMFKLGAQISKPTLSLMSKPSPQQHSPMTCPQSSSSPKSSDASVDNSSSIEAFWSHSSNSMSTSKIEEIILQKDESPSCKTTSSKASYSLRTNTSESQKFNSSTSKESEFLPSTSFKSFNNHKSNVHTRAQYIARQSSIHDSPISLEKSSDCDLDKSSQTSSLLRLPVFNEVRSDVESSISSSSRLDSPLLPTPFRRAAKDSPREENSTISKNESSPPLSSPSVASTSDVHIDLDLIKSFSHIPP